MIQSLVITLGGFIVTTVLLGTFFFLFLSIIGLGRHLSAGGIYGFFCAASLLGIPPIFYEIKKRALQRTIYNFYDDYMDFQYFHWYINRRRGRVRYTDIADIAQHASALEEHQRLITIFIYVPGMGMGRRGAFSGVKMADLPQSKDYMSKIMDLLEGRAATATAAVSAPVPQAQPAEAPGAAVTPAQPETAAAAPIAATPAPASPTSPPPVTDG